MDDATRHREHLETLRAGYDDALGGLGLERVLIHSGAPSPKSAHDDQAWPLRVAPHFQHWLPLQQADCWIDYRPGSRPVLHRPRAQDFWEGAAPGDEALLAPFEVVEAAIPQGLLDDGVALIADAAPDGVDPARVRDDAATRLRARLDGLRSIKTPYERENIAAANRLAAGGHRELQRRFAEGGHGDSELSLHLAYLRATDQDDSWTPYKNIVAVGVNAATLHHVHYGVRAAAPCTSLLVDAGATHLGYHSDVTRTAVRGEGDAAQVFAALIAAMDAMQLAICDDIRVGERYEQLHDSAHHRLAAVLRDVGLGRGTTEALVDAGVTRAFFPHGLGHSLGLQTHDVGCKPVPPASRNPHLRNTSTIAAGQVFTVEPGCYFIEPLLSPLRQGAHGKLVDWALVDRLAPFGGVRVEDDILVTADGHRNLTREALAALPDEA